MRTCFAAGLGLCAALLAGCSSAPPNKPEPVDVTVTVTLPNGQPGGGLNLMLLPTSSEQMQGGGRTDNSGKVKAKAVPGKHTFSFDGAPASVPKKYHTNDASHTVDVPPTGGDIAIKLTN